MIILILIATVNGEYTKDENGNITDATVQYGGYGRMMQYFGFIYVYSCQL